MNVKNLQADKKSTSSIFGEIAANDHEQVVFCYDKSSGLKSIIAIHNTTLGPALGGTRFWDYESDQAALKDVLRLSRGMTYKAAITGLHLGGGKAIIIGNSQKDKSEALFRRYGKFVNGLSGRYITAEDVGTSEQDMEWISRETEYVSGVPEYMGGGGDPSPFTAYGTFLGIKACVKELYGNDSLEGKKVGVQGAGHVGQHLMSYLKDAGAKIYVTDIRKESLKKLVEEFNATIVEPEDIYDIDMDIYSPCALGATVNSETIGRLKCQIIAGAANNQLEDEEIHGEMLIDKGILYAPDFLINAGGLINVSAELDGYNKAQVLANTEKIYDRTLEIFRLAKAEKITTQKAAITIAEKRLQDIAKVNAKL